MNKENTILKFNIAFHLQIDGQTKKVQWDIKSIFLELCD
jgi:hypothetical protein